MLASQYQPGITVYQRPVFACEQRLVRELALRKRVVPVVVQDVVEIQRLKNCLVYSKDLVETTVEQDLPVPNTKLRSTTIHKAGPTVVLPTAVHYVTQETIERFANQKGGSPLEVQEQFDDEDCVEEDDVSLAGSEGSELVDPELSIFQDADEHEEEDDTRNKPQAIQKHWADMRPFLAQSQSRLEPEPIDYGYGELDCGWYEVDEGSHTPTHEDQAMLESCPFGPRLGPMASPPTPVIVSKPAPRTPLAPVRPVPAQPCLPYEQKNAGKENVHPGSIPTSPSSDFKEHAWAFAQHCPTLQIPELPAMDTRTPEKRVQDSAAVIDPLPSTPPAAQFNISYSTPENAHATSKGTPDSELSANETPFLNRPARMATPDTLLSATQTPVVSIDCTPRRPYRKRQVSRALWQDDNKTPKGNPEQTEAASGSPSKLAGFTTPPQTPQKQESCGAGLVLRRQDGSERVEIAKVLRGGPAYVSGEVQEGDTVLAVNWEDATGADADELSRRLRGPIGSQVVLLTWRPGDRRDFTRTVRLTRRSLHPSTPLREFDGYFLCPTVSEFDS
mmetsp:Transcript_36239/g.82600  ORF Transcript_36239/g.82600 Transcript_36239/m.82600 type:complete len:560 (+) Transcript_36239:46-1725(+)